MTSKLIQKAALYIRTPPSFSGQDLRQLRLYAKLTVDQAADIVGRTPMQWYRYQGMDAPPREIVKKLLNFILNKNNNLDGLK